MQPVQPSLIPDPHPGPAAPLVDHLPEEAVAAAIMLLAAVIAKTAAPEGSRWTPMSELKITASHLRRAAVVYVRQSTLAQVERNTESTARQYDLATRAAKLGWPRSAVRVIDDDLGLSGASTTGRSGFAELAAQVGLGQVGIVLSLECSRLARNNADWYRLLDLAGMADTLIADADGVYHPALFNDRLLLGMKGTMSEAELHILRARLDGGIRNKAARGELRRGLPVGLVWGEADGEIGWHPDEAVTGLITAIFDRFAVTGSVRGVWLWLRDQGLQFPLQPAGYLHGADITWVEPTYHAVHNVLTHPGYAGAYVFGKTRQQRYVGEDDQMRIRRRRLPQGEWEVLITDHHRGFIDWDTYQANQARIGNNIRPMAHQPGTGAVREGCALLQGLAICGRCGRRLAVYYDGPAKSTPGYYCTGTGQLVEGRGTRHLRVGGAAIDAAVAEAFLAALAPAALQACLAAARQLEDGHDAALAQWRRQVEQARYRAGRAERRYRAVDPDNRLVARALESEWNHALQQLADAEAELACRETARPKTSRRRRSRPSSPSEMTSTDYGRRRPPPTRTASSCCAPCWRRSPSACTATRPKAAPIWCCGGRAARSPNYRCRSNASHPRSAPTKTPSTCYAAWPHTTPTPRSPGSSTGKGDAPHGNCPSPPVGSKASDTHGPSPATSPATIHNKESCSPWPTPPTNWAWPPQPCTAGSARIHRRRTAHPRRTLADPAHRRHPLAVRR